MFASQLLRILETIPTDVKPQTCGSSEQDMTMMENRSSTAVQGSSFGSKEICSTNGSRSETCPLALNDFWNSDAQSSTEEEFQNVLIDPLNRPNVDAVYDPKDSKSPSIATLKQIKPYNGFCADKTLFKCDTPELVVCYKDTDYNVSNDICIDEGTSSSDQILIRSSEDKVEKPKSKSRSESHSDEDAAGDLAHKTEKDSFTSDATGSDGSIEDSFIDRALPIQEFGTRSFLRSFFISLDSEGNKPVQLLDQISLDKGLPESPTVSSTESDLKENVQASSSFSYDTRVESKIITFNFNSRAPEKSRIKGSSVDTRDKLDRKNSDSHNHSYSSQVHCHRDACTEKVHEESLNVKDMMDKNVHNGDDNSDDVGVHVPKVKHDLTERGLEKHEHGETSFSDVGFISPEPIPTPGTESISFRSDSSATSGKSFAFPVLQSEWNSSPVRMTNAERRNFRKHKFWRSGLLCCRF